MTLSDEKAQIASAPDRNRSASGQSLVLPFVCLGLAIGLASAAQKISFAWFKPGFNWPNLPNVATVPWNPSSDFFSSTAQLFGGIFVSLAAAALLEPVKVLVLRRKPRTTYLVALATQIAVLVEGFVNACPDWAGHAASLLISQGRKEFWIPVGGRISWISLCLGGVLVALEVSFRHRLQEEKREPG